MSPRTLCIALSAFLAVAAAQNPSPRLRVTWKDTVITVRRGDHAIAIPMPEQIANYQANVKVLFIRQTTQSLYILFEIEGPSKEPGRENEQCGKGIERGIFLAEITSDWKLGRSQALQTESCWDGVEENDRKYDPKLETLLLDVSDYRQKMTRTLSYDNHFPQRGLQIKERPL
jgi:hypothetical protein